MATGKSHCICNEMQGILSKHSSASFCDLLRREWFLCGGTCADLWHSHCLFCKKLTEVIQSVIFAWGSLTRCIIKIEEILQIKTKY